MAKRVVIDGTSLTVEEVARVARGGAKAVLAVAARRAVRKSNGSYTAAIRDGSLGYEGTGRENGASNGRPWRPDEEIDRRIIHAHVAGTGDPHPAEVVRAAILCRVNTYAKGCGGVRLELVDMLVELLNRGITPLLHEKGPVGTTGAMSQVAEVLMGGGEVYYKGELLPSALAMKKAGIGFFTPNHSEGLSLINGPHIMTGELALRCVDTHNLLKNAVIASAMTIEVLHVSHGALDPRIHALRPHPGQGAVAENIRRMTVDSTIETGGPGTIPAAHSLQCTPQILGPSLDALTYVTERVRIEMNSAADEHLFPARERIHLRGGHVHAQPIAMAADFLSTAAAEVASLSERHVNRLLNPALSGLPGFLVEGEGLITGLASAQHTAASLVSENKVLAHPRVVDSISISADREDHVSMAPIAVRTLREIVSNTAAVIAIEMLCAAQALDFRKPKKPGRGTRAAYRTIRKAVPRLESDRPLYPDIRSVTELVLGGSIVKSVERSVGPLSMGGDRD